MKLKSNNFSLTKIPAKEILKFWSEAIELTASNYRSIIVAGEVDDLNGNPIENAFVQIMDEENNPVYHGFTNEEGKYLLNNIPMNSKYNILVKANNKKIYYGNSFEGILDEVKIINFILEDDITKEYSIIAGSIIDDDNMENVIKSAIITLSKLDENYNEKLIDVTYTNENGQYIFTDVMDGEYIISVTASGYLNKIVNKKVENKINNVIEYKINLQLEKDMKKGSISGIITDYNDNPLGNTNVVLYSINKENSLKPIAFTKSNEKGMYLFTNIPEGNYKIMSKQDEIINIEE
ncbi:MSCRAMM family protein [Clostridium tarantellae]|uniref:Carboxypeptidase regulatory-like domain-containing protein n=1 Tax=Clostridium tarantellae TaxID=39493 RepID=A0A6I1MJT8_9CLOT|nr:carboxypeptidase-like regulatory domain-containing protein [Clostridium tarantellae]MPQ43204.1 hypothetical protein [Clostridium tarantellae]